MSKVNVAIKPSRSNKKLLDIIPISTARKLEALFDNNKVAIVFGNMVDEDYVETYYPVNNVNEAAEQFELAASGTEPTVDKDDSWGLRKPESFVHDITITDEYNKIMHKVEYNANKFTGNVIKVINPDIVDIDEIDKVGYWIAFYFDKTTATSGTNTKYTKVSYSDILDMSNRIELEDGVNYLYLGNNEGNIYKRSIILYGEGKNVETGEEFECDSNIYFRLTPVVIKRLGTLQPILPDDVVLDHFSIPSEDKSLIEDLEIVRNGGE